MAVTASGLYYITFRDALKGSGIALTLDSETDNKIALYSNSITPNFDTDTAQSAAPYNANECTGTNWAAGGVVLTTTTLSVSTGTFVWTAANVSVASTTLTAVRAGLIYGLQATTKNCVCLVNFTSDYSTNNGTFAITWNGSGIFTIDLTP